LNRKVLLVKLNKVRLFIKQKQLGSLYLKWKDNFSWLVCRDSNAMTQNSIRDDNRLIIEYLRIDYEYFSFTERYTQVN